jgi:hypothetical protein
MRFRLSGKIFPWKKISAVGRFLFLQDQKFQGRSVVLGISAGVPGSKVSDELAAVRRHVKKEGHGGAPVIEVLRDASPFECLCLTVLPTGALSTIAARNGPRAEQVEDKVARSLFDAETCRFRPRETMSYVCHWWVSPIAV